MPFEEFGRPRLSRLRDGRSHKDLPIVLQSPVHLGSNQGLADDRLCTMPKLCRNRSKKLPSNRHIVEEASHRNLGALWTACRLSKSEPSALDHHALTFALILGPREEFEATHRCDRRERLSSKAKTRDTEEVLFSSNLRGAMPLQAHEGVSVIHSSTVVHHSNQLAASCLQLNMDSCCTGIEAVLDQFFEGSGGTLNHLTCGDLVDQAVFENSDLAHQSSALASPGRRFLR